MRKRSEAGSHSSNRFAPNLAAAETTSPMCGAGSFRVSHRKRSRWWTLPSTASCLPASGVSRRSTPANRQPASCSAAADASLTAMHPALLGAG